MPKYDPAKVEELVAAAHDYVAAVSSKEPYAPRSYMALCDAVKALAPKRHTFGGIVFEETGEIGPPQPGRFYLESDGEVVRCARFKAGLVGVKYTQLRPISLEAE